MKPYSFIVSFLLFFLLQGATAQTYVQPYGKVDQATFDLKQCPFEPDANAMVLFDKGDVYFNSDFDIVYQRHKRIKIFNEHAKDEADFRIEYYSIRDYEKIISVQAQTINQKDGKTVITKLANNQKFTQQVDKYRSAIVFTLPDVQPGSILEIKYTLQTASFGNFPTWKFQSSLPVAYSELTTSVPDMIIYKPLIRTSQPFEKNKTSSASGSYTSGGQVITYNKDVRTMALKDVPSLPEEPFMTSKADNLQSVMHQLVQIRPVGGFVSTGNDTWAKIGAMLVDDEDFGSQFKKRLEGEQELIQKASAMSSNDARIAYLFKEVKTRMKWNEHDNWYTNDGIGKAWEKKTGNSAELNLILYRLLYQSGVKDAQPMVVSTRDNGRVNVAFPWIYQFNRAVVYIPIDSARYYVLDATEKSNQYNIVPRDLLNNFALIVDRENKTADAKFLQAAQPSIENILIQGSIDPEGHITGKVKQFYSLYNRSNLMKRLLEKGKEKNNELLSDKDSKLKVEGVNLEHDEADSLFVNQDFNFNIETAGSDGNYIYFNPNMFSSLKINPFLKESRKTLIDFGCGNQHFIQGAYSIPAGYAVDVLPKSINMVMPDKSITFKRITGVQENTIVTRFVIDFKKSIYFPEDYPELHEFYKQMYQMLNEQIVLKRI